MAKQASTSAEERLRELITEANGTIKDLQRENKNLRNLIKEVADKAFEDRINPIIEDGLKQLANILDDNTKYLNDTTHDIYDCMEGKGVYAGKAPSMQEIVTAIRIGRFFSRRTGFPAEELAKIPQLPLAARRSLAEFFITEVFSDEDLASLGALNLKRKKED